MAKITQKSVYVLIVLLLITILGSYLRLDRISANPVSLYSDEADIAYQAFVFNQCQTDYFGNKFPSSFHSFSDYQPPLYIYSVALSQNLFKNRELSTRFPAAFFGILTIPALFLLSRILFSSNITAFISSFVLAVNPWHIHFSRTGFAVSLMLLLLIMANYFFIKFTNSSKLRYLLFFALLSVISLYSYSTAKVFIMFNLLVLGILYFKKIITIPLKSLLIIFALSFLILIPLLKDTVNGSSGYRFNYIGIFTEPTIPSQVNYQRYIDAIVAHGLQIGLSPGIFSSIVHNKITNTFNIFLTNYLGAFSTDFLFLKGDLNLRHGFGSFGYLYPFEAILLIFGLFQLRSLLKFEPIQAILILFLLSPIPSALTRDSATPHGTRLILMLPFLIIFISLGITFIFRHLINPKLLITGYLLLITVYLINLVLFNHHYFTHYPQISARSWHIGQLQAADFVNNNYPDSTLYFSNQFEPFTPFLLLSSKYVPLNCQSPAASIEQVQNKYMSGRQINNHYYWGNYEWKNIVSSPDINGVYIVPQFELSGIRSQLAQNPSLTPYYINILTTIVPPYETAEPVVIFKLSHDQKI